MTSVATEAPLLGVAGLTVSYTTDRGVVRAVADASLVVKRGEVVALIGESGSGKTTLARALLGLLPRAAHVVSGAARFAIDGSHAEELLHRSDHELRALRGRHIGYVAQGSISSFNPLLRVSQHFRETAVAHGVAWRSLQGTVGRLLRAVRLDPERVLAAYPHELSGGTRQRVAIALALLLQPSLVVLDEPTTALDVISQRDVLSILADLRDETGVSLLIVSHDLDVAAFVADRIVTMYAGRVVEESPAAALIDDPFHPYSRALLNAVPRLAADVDVEAVGGNPPDLMALPRGCPFHPRCPHALAVCSAGAPPPLDAVGNDRRVACWLHEPERHE